SRSVLAGSIPATLRIGVVARSVTAQSVRTTASMVGASYTLTPKRTLCIGGSAPAQRSRPAARPSAEAPTPVLPTWNGVLLMEELARECLVDYNHMLRISTVCISERSARQHGNLQGLEIARADVHLVCGDLPSRLFAVTERDRTEQRTLIGQRQSNGIASNALGLAQRGQAVCEQLSES